jgi:hypothetical protein
MQHRIAIMAIAAAALIMTACADQDGGRRLATEPGGTNPVVSYVTNGVPAIIDPKTHRPVDVTSDAWRGRVSASVVAGSVVDGGLQVAFNDPGVASTGGRAIWSFTDDARHVQKVVFLYPSGGGPPAAMQHYTDDALVSITAYTWARTQIGWVRTRSYMQSVRNGSLVGTFTTTSTPAKSGTGGSIETVRLDRAPAVSPVQRTLGALAYALAFAFAPQDATAQGFYFYECRQEWLRYAAAAAVLAGASAAIAAAPEFTPALATAYAAALATTAAMEDVLIDCMLAHDTLSSGGFGSGTFSSGGFGGAGGGGAPPAKACLEGSYAAHCTTAFTL